MHLVSGTPSRKKIGHSHRRPRSAGKIFELSQVELHFGTIGQKWFLNKTIAEEDKLFMLAGSPRDAGK